MKTGEKLITPFIFLIALLFELPGAIGGIFMAFKRAWLVTKRDWIERSW